MHRMVFRYRFIISMLAIASLQMPVIAQNESSLQYYSAAIAAAQSNMQLHRFQEANYWLNSAPAAYRGWEWHYLNHTLNQNTGAINLTYTCNDIAISSDGKLLAAAGDDHLVHVYDISSKKEITSFTPHLGRAYSVAFDPSGKIIYSSGQDATLVATLIETGKPLWSQKIPAGINALSLRPDGKQLAVSANLSNGYGSRGDTYIFDAVSGMLIFKRGEFKNKPIAINYSQDGTMLAIGGENGIVEVLSTDSFLIKQTFTLNNAEAAQQIKDMVFSADGSYLMATGGGKFAQIWNMFTRSTQNLLYGDQQQITSLLFTPNGFGMLTGAADGSIQLWSTESATIKQSLYGHTGTVKKIRCTSDGAVAISLSDDNTIRFWDLATAGTYLNPMGFSGLTYGFELSANGKYLYTQGEFGLITVWNNNTGFIEKQFPSLPELMNDLAVNPAGTLLAACDWDGHVRAYEISTGKRYDDYFGVNGGIVNLDYSPDGKQLAATSTDSMLVIWDSESGGMLQQLKCGGEAIDVVYAGNGGKIAAGTKNGMVQVWNTSDFSSEFSVSCSARTINNINFSPDGKIIAAACADGNIYLIDISSKSIIHVLKGHSKAVYSVAFTPDGSRLFSGGDDGVVRVWETASWTSVLSFSEFPAGIYQVLVSSDGNHLFVNTPSVDFRRYSIK